MIDLDPMIRNPSYFIYLEAFSWNLHSYKVSGLDLRSKGTNCKWPILWYLEIYYALTFLGTTRAGRDSYFTNRHIMFKIITTWIWGGANTCELKLDRLWMDIIRYQLPDLIKVIYTHGNWWLMKCLIMCNKVIFWVKWGRLNWMCSVLRYVYNCRAHRDGYVPSVSVFKSSTTRMRWIQNLKY